MRKDFIVRALFLVCAVMSFGALAQNGNATPITDNQGLIRYIIDFTKDAPQGQPTQIKAGELLNDGLPEWHKPEMRHFAKGIARQFSLTPLSITSWVGNSITAYLTPDQVVALQNDKRVTLITQDRYLGFSSWPDSVSGGETTSWGTIAVNGGNPINHTGTNIKVYVLDSGVGYHTDLGGYNSTQVQRYNPNYDAQGNPVNPVGCYTHSTHVAGIIGAQVNNSGTRGVNPGVPIVSVSLGTSNLNTNNGPCSDSSRSVSSIALGMDMVMQLVVQNGIQNGWFQPGILNISFNDYAATTETANIYSYGSTLGNKLYALTLPYGGFSYYYPGVFIVQSAGNSYGDACIHAFNGFLGGGANPNDGIMVVGGIDNSGAPVMGQNAFIEPNGVTIPGSNYGRCVDVWAPAQKIWSMWGGSPYGEGPSAATGDQSSTALYSNIGYLSGTSMAAPHIAGLASYLAETQNLTTPAQIEAAVRAHFIWTGYYDALWYRVYMPQL